MYSKIIKLGLTVASFALLSVFVGSVNAQSTCASNHYTGLNNTKSQEYALNDNCRDLHINLDNYQSYVERIKFEAHDFGSNYVMDIYYRDNHSGIYYLVNSRIDIATNDNNCGDRNNEPDFGENRCFKDYRFDVYRNTTNILLRIYTEPGKTFRSNEYAYIKDIRIEGKSNAYPTYTPTPYPTQHSKPNLMVEDIIFSPENPEYYQNVDVSVVIRNKNGNDYARGFYVRMYKNGQEIGNTYYNDTLYSGSAFTWKLNNLYMDSGYNTIKIVVDTDNRINENNENDNERSENVYKSGYNYNPTPTPYYPYNPFNGNVLGNNTNIYFNGNCNVVFTDVYGTRYYNTINAATCYGITKGYSDNTYRPESYITRAEYISMLVRSFPEAFNSFSNCGYYRDVNNNDIHGYNINRARCSGIARGYSDNTFRPSSYISYGEAASILYNLLVKYGYNANNLPMNYQPYFMNPNSPHYNSVYYLSNMNPYSNYPAYDYYYGSSMHDGNYATRGWIANSIVNARSYMN